MNRKLLAMIPTLCMKQSGLLLFCVAAAVCSGIAKPESGDGTYSNPIIHADYSDPDVVRVGDDFYMTASSFNCVPALPILHSKDMIHWTLINHAAKRLPPLDVFDKPQHGKGVWAPAIRYHEGWFYIFWGDPDYGIYMVKTEDPAGEWEPPHLVRAGKGLIDPCPFWDDDGQAYLVHALAGSRVNINSIVILHRMAPDGTSLLDDGVLVFDGNENHRTMEGTKMHKRNGYYYILAPAGGVPTGWQTVLRSRHIYGPYEDRIVLHQGGTDVNGPHQGAWVELDNGEHWFFHFQEKQPYGRIVHLQPARMENDWLLIGKDINNDGIGEPVSAWDMPTVGRPQAADKPQTSDEFNRPELGLQWQWQANPGANWLFPTAMGYLRMNPVVLHEEWENLWKAPGLLLQKMPAEQFTATAKLKFHHHHDGERTGLIVMGRDYATLILEQHQGELVIKQAVCQNADQGRPEETVAAKSVNENELYLRVKVSKGGLCRFFYSLDGERYEDIGAAFQAREGKWIGAKIGFFAARKDRQNYGGYAEYDWFRIE